MLLRPTVFDAAMNEIAERSKKALYQRDYLAWAADILGRRYYAKMNEIAVTITDPNAAKTRTAVKSANGCGKSFILSDIGTWWITAFPPEESLAIFSANGRDQIQRVVFKYLKDNYGFQARRAKEGKGSPPIGWISEQLEWNYMKPDGSGKEALAFGKRPADQDIVSSFQGTRKRRTFVGFDEMGGMPEDLFTAAEAVLTGQDSRWVGIGNPDRRATPFHTRFNDKQQASEWNLFTISAYDLPTMTGEIVYPDEPDKQAAMLKGLTSAEWIAHKERVWKIGGEIVFDDKLGLDRNPTGRPDGRFKAKVLGEFPSEDDRAFFPEDFVTAAREKEITLEDSAGAPVLLGVDLAAMGEDESVVMVNKGGRCRVFDETVSYKDGEELRTTTGTWSKEDELSSARRVHAIAKHLGATEVRVDAAGLGSGIATMLERLDEFKPRQYTVLRISGGTASADKDRWSNARAQNHDWLRELLRENVLDIDYDDKALLDQLLAVTYDTNKRGAVEITPKKDMRSEMHGSPDRLDALIYAVLDSGPLLEALERPKVGSAVAMTSLEEWESRRQDPSYPM